MYRQRLAGKPALENARRGQWSCKCSHPRDTPPAYACSRGCMCVVASAAGGVQLTMAGCQSGRGHFAHTGRANNGIADECWSCSYMWLPLLSPYPPLPRVAPRKGHCKEKTRTLQLGSCLYPPLGRLYVTATGRNATVHDMRPAFGPVFDPGGPCALAYEPAHLCALTHSPWRHLSLCQCGPALGSVEIAS